VGSDGRPITIRQLMEKGISVLEKSYGDDPRFVIGMLINMSGRYMDLGDTTGEHTALVKAERLARQVGDPDLIARVQCNTVETELALGRPRDARERMSDGLANLAKVSDPSYDRKTECGLAQARLLWSEGNLPEAIDAATKVAGIIEAAHKTDEDLAYQSVTSMLEVMLGQEGRRREAREWNARAIAALERSGREATMSMSNARHNQATHFYNGGEVRAAFEQERALVAQLVAQQGIDSVPAPFGNRLGVYQTRIEGTDAAFAWFDRAVNTAQSLNNRLDQIGAYLGRAQGHVFLGRFDGVEQDLAAAERLAQDNPGENRDYMRAARFIRAQMQMARGEHEAVVKELNAILAEVEYPQRRVASRLAPMLILKARAELALGRKEAALATARDALSIAEAIATNPGQSADVGGALMAMAESQRAAGDIEGARASAQRAAISLAGGLGPHHPETLAAQQFR
jgi:tetratricopeptide (TPR) repeat protein